MASSVRTYITDAVALGRYFEDALPSGANRAFLEAEQGRALMLVPEIAIGEFIYVALKGRLRKDKVYDQNATITELLENIESSSYLKPTQMTPVCWQNFLKSTVTELHDRMIHAIAMSLDPASSPTIVTNDSELSKVFRTVW